MIDLFDYTDYCTFLKDFYAERKKKFSFFSYRFLGQKVGIDPGNLVKILQGKRHLSAANMKRFTRYAQFSARETKYFETLVQFKKAKKEKDNKILFQKLMDLQRTDPYRVQPLQYEFYSQYYHTAILALLSFIDFTGDYKALAPLIKPPISVKQAKESVKLLLKLDLIRKDSSGRFVLTNNIISTGSGWRSLAIHSFQEQCLKLAREALANCPAKERDISTVTIAIAPEDLEEIKRITSEYRQTILQIAAASDNADRVFQLSINLFPLSEQVSPHEST